MGQAPAFDVEVTLIDYAKSQANDNDETEYLEKVDSDEPVEVMPWMSSNALSFRQAFIGISTSFLTLIA